MTDEHINDALVDLRRSMNNDALVDLRRSMNDGTAEPLQKRHDELLTLLVQRAVDTPQTMTISDWTAVIP